jgi:hypothetical protein
LRLAGRLEKVQAFAGIVHRRPAARRLTLADQSFRPPIAGSRGKTGEDWAEDWATESRARKTRGKPEEKMPALVLEQNARRTRALLRNGERHKRPRLAHSL